MNRRQRKKYIKKRFGDFFTAERVNAYLDFLESSPFLDYIRKVPLAGRDTVLKTAGSGCTPDRGSTPPPSSIS